MREKKKILIVDDNEDIVMTYRMILDRMGYGVMTAEDGRECLAMVDEYGPDLLLLDVRLPGLSGTEVCRLIKETSETKDIKIVAMTASMSVDTREKMIEAGVDDFLLKPIDVSALNSIVKKYLGE